MDVIALKTTGGGLVRARLKSHENRTVLEKRVRNRIISYTFETQRERVCSASVLGSLGVGDFFFVS